ncbi:MAG: hypothetical protein ACFFCH_10450 [Promethearchaeota archaeon]
MHTVPRNPLGLVDYAFRAMGKTQVSIQQLVFFISFDLRQISPSEATKMILDLKTQGKLTIEDGIVIRPHLVKTEPQPPTASSDLGEQLQLFVSASRLSRAVGMNDKAVEFTRISKSPLKIKATVQGTKEYTLEIDEERKRISHDCPDWRRVSVIHRFCKHIAKLFLLLEKEEAIRLLQSLQKNTWEFVQL